MIGHRGAAAWCPEHTLAAYARAIADGADFIEPDLVMSGDGALIVRHENEIGETTDVARRPEFAGRRTGKRIEGTLRAGWFTEDFTLAELKTLRAIERLPALRPASAALDGRFGIVTWPELIAFAEDQARARGRRIGLAPELKHPTHFRAIGLPLEEPFLASIARQGNARRCPLIIQSFEPATLRALQAKLGRPADIRLMQLVAGDDPAARPADIAAAGGTLTYREMMTAAGLAAIAGYADILAPDARSIIPLAGDGRLGRAGPLVADAHRAGLAVMPWTFRPENIFLPADLRDDAGDRARNPAGSIAEIRAYLAAGIDGFFTDDPALGRAALRTDGLRGVP